MRSRRVRSDRDPSAVLASLRGAILRLDPELPLSDALPAVDVVGARGSAVMWSVLRRAVALMAIGVAVGTAGALALTRETGLLYEIRPTDAATFAGSALLALLAVAASCILAWRATRVDPLVPLRAE